MGGDLGEWFFRQLYRGAAARRAACFVNQAVLGLEESNCLTRLEVISQAICTTPVRICFSDALEPSDTSTLFLPREIGIGRNQEDNFAIYLYKLLVFHAACLNHQYSESDHQDGVEVIVESILLAPRIHALIHSSYPGFDELLERIRSVVQGSVESFSAVDSRFKRLGHLIVASLSLSDPNTTPDEVRILIRQYRPEWLRSPYCPLLAVGILRKKNPNRPKFGRYSEQPESAPIEGEALPRATNSKKQEVKIRTTARPEVKTLHEKEESPLSHVFEKLLTAEEHQGGAKAQDGSDESEEHAEALSELTLDSVIRSQTPTDSVIKSSALIDSAAFDLGSESESAQARVFRYKEWFQEERSFREQFCTLYESTSPSESVVLDANRSTEEHRQLSERLSSFLNESRWKPRQKEGIDLDLDAVVRWRTQIKGNGPVDQRLYIGRRRIERNLVVLILLDSSLSTDAWVENRRVLDIMKSSITIVGGALSSLNDRFAVATFNSYSRQRCRFNWVKQFVEPWSTSQKRLNALKPEGFTRIGPALRHAHAVLDQMKARRKLILLFSDGRPSDYDPYEGIHGLSDVRRAVNEIRSDGIMVKGIAVTQENRGNLVRMFGSGQYRIVHDPVQVAQEVVHVFTEMMGEK